MPMEPSVDAIIQARMGATRLPGKVLLPFAGGTILEFIVKRATLIPRVRNVIVATSIEKSDDPLVQKCKTLGISYFRGSETDVLSRYAGAAAEFKSDVVIRLTGDNPFFDIGEVGRMCDVMFRDKLDYVTNHGIPDTPIGIGAEVCTSLALAFANERITNAYEREHVTPYFYEHPEQFRQFKLAPEVSYDSGDMRLTLDTEADYAMLIALAEAFPVRDYTVETRAIISFLKARPEIVSMNASVQQKSYK